MAAAHHISLAKASFGVSLLRPDVTTVSRSDLPELHAALERVLDLCSPNNIQTCKSWLLEHVVVSAQRTAALGKYLTAISKHISARSNQHSRASAPRQRLHILYLLNDLHHHARYHTPDGSLLDNLTHSLPPFLLELYQLAAVEAKRKVLKRLNDLVEIWKNERYYSRDHLGGIQRAIQGDVGDLDVAHPGPDRPNDQRESKELPYIMPATHGDPSAPFYELPAGNMMPHILPNSSEAIRTDQIRALHLTAGPADGTLVNALKDFLEDVGKIDNAFATADDGQQSPEIDEMGQLSYRDETGDLVGDSYYGWSRLFCQQMKSRDRSAERGSYNRKPEPQPKSQPQPQSKQKREKAEAFQLIVARQVVGTIQQITVSRSPATTAENGRPY